MTTFRAGVQYGDWEGTAAADASDQIELHKYLRDKGLLSDNEFLLAADLYAGENHHGKVEHVSIRAYVYEGERSFDNLKPILDDLNGPIPVREVRLSMSLEKFVGLFKRFNVFLTWHGLELTDRDLEVQSEQSEEDGE